ncbi:hypothetical protein FFONT_1167 [Fervidicoccus fontis Kam940]|uniref:Uncharacterized protein n=1 Tax=Fervidicoccus fontis (strain DSM 19380 / JCM 18336 / VKM B-2539 / Kam940) TaxID=1163730 RepID=I0A2E8_FERFK|nr:hypothetical protein FFONT_1167 [Fervidicoccus fontis Kam940]
MLFPIHEFPLLFIYVQEFGIDALSSALPLYCINDECSYNV